MAPVSLPLSSLLRHRDCVQKANMFCNVLRVLHHRPLTSSAWKRNLGSVSRGVGQLLPHQPAAKNYAASVCSSSSASQDMTERLWSVYNEARRQTKGRSTHSTERSFSNTPLRCIHNCNNPAMTHAPSFPTVLTKPAWKYSNNIFEYVTCYGYKLWYWFIRVLLWYIAVFFIDSFLLLWHIPRYSCVLPI